jgi:murein DD-endopeptidase MepM/ murein hydrolase activator NlpD
MTTSTAPISGRPASYAHADEEDLFAALMPANRPPRRRRPAVARGDSSSGRPRRAGWSVCLAVALLLTALGLPTAPATATPTDTGPGSRKVAATPPAAQEADKHAEKRDQGKEGRHAERHGHTDGRGESRTDRQLLAAATWRLDPELLTVTADDSPRTRRARARLGEINDELLDANRDYVGKQARAAAARDAAAAAEKRLHKAQKAARRARAQYEADRLLMANLVTSSYETTSKLAPLNVLSRSESPDDLLTGMTLIAQLAEGQNQAVLEAQTSAKALRYAVDTVEVLAAEADRKLDRASTELAGAAEVRDRVLSRVKAAQAILRSSVLADEAARLLREKRLAAQAAALTSAQEAAARKGGVAFPLPKGAGFRDNDNWGHSSGRWARGHTGNDFSVACGTPVLAATAGRIRILTDQSWSGPWLVMVSTGEGRLTTWYAHMEAIGVRPGQRVRAGQPIGLVGTEGNSTGCHLHFEVHPFGGSIYEDNIDPAAWLKAAGAYPK